MPAPMSLPQFRRLIAAHGCHLEPTGGCEWKVMKDGKVVCYLAIAHGARREVKPVYVARFRRVIAQLEAEAQEQDNG
jgi:hypothetical protein